MELILIDDKQQRPLYMQLYEYFKTAIENGKLTAGERLPSIRQLAKSLSISNITVQKAYMQLLSEGYINNCNRSRYKVAVLEKMLQSLPNAVSHRPMPRAEVRYDFSSGDMDINGFDFSIWKKYLNKTILDKQRLMGYGQNRGEPELCAEIARYVGSRGVECYPEQIVVGPGVQSLLNILASLLKTTRHRIAFEEPGFANGRQIWADWGFDILPVMMTRSGIDIDKLVSSGAKLVYLTPSHQFPTGYIMPIGMRTKLLNWARQAQALIIEDDYDSEFRYFGRPIPALKGLDTDGNVVYLGSFSKVIPPSIRMSYMVLPEQLLCSYERNSQLYNQAASTIEQLALAKYMAGGHLERQIRRLRKLYGDKKEMFIAAVKQVFGELVTVSDTDSGIHVVVTIKTKASSQAVAAAASRCGCRVAPVADYYWRNAPADSTQVILYFSKVPAQEFSAALQLLKKAWFAQPD